MLAKHPIDVMLMATDLETARRFYGDRVGLDVLIENDDFVTFGCGGDSRLVVTRTSSPSGEQQTKASWRVADVVAEVTELRARGVDVVEYDEPAAANGHPERDAELRVALARLPDQQRTAVFLRYYADLDYAAIGEALGITRGTVAATLNSAHTTLRTRLEEVRT